MNLEDFSKFYKNTLYISDEQPFKQTGLSETHIDMNIDEIFSFVKNVYLPNKERILFNPIPFIMYNGKEYGVVFNGMKIDDKIYPKKSKLYTSFTKIEKHWNTILKTTDSKIYIDTITSVRFLNKKDPYVYYYRPLVSYAVI